MSLKKLSVSCGLPADTLKLFKKEEFIGGFMDSQETADEINALKYLFMVRFSLEQIKTMFTQPDLISATLKAHVYELSHSERPYPALVSILKGVDLSVTHDIFALGRRIGELFILPEDEFQSVSDLKKSCGEIEAVLLKAKKYHQAESAIYLFAMLPILGFPFGFIRSHLLSRMGDMMNSADELIRPFSEALSNIEPFFDFMQLSNNYDFGSRNYGVALTGASAASYSFDVDAKFDFYWERHYSAKRLLDSLKFCSETKV